MTRHIIECFHLCDNSIVESSSCFKRAVGQTILTGSPVSNTEAIN